MNTTQSQSEIKNKKNIVQYQRNTRSSKDIFIIEDISDTDIPGNVQNSQDALSTVGKLTQRPRTKNNTIDIVQMSKREDEIIEGNSSINLSQINETFSGDGDIKFVKDIRGSLQRSQKSIVQSQSKIQPPEEKIQQHHIPELKVQQSSRELQDPSQKGQSEKDKTQNESNNQLQNQSKGQEKCHSQIVHMRSQIKKNQLERQRQVVIETPKNKRNPTQEKQLDSNSNEQQVNTQKAIKQFDQNYFDGKLSVVWVFVIAQLDAWLQQQLNKLFQSLVSRGYQKLWSRSMRQAEQSFFHAENSIFNVVCDLTNAEDLLTNRFHLGEKILSIHLYNDDPIDGIMRATNLKQRSSKVKGIHKDLTLILKRAKLDINNGNKFIQDSNTIHEIKFKSKFPTFIKLSNEDASQITAYRINLYGAIKLTDQHQRMEKLQQFASLVKRVYHKNQNQLSNLQDYLHEINHLVCELSNEVSKELLLEKHKNVLSFYVRETFYYKITNNLSRTCRSVNDFKPLILPFNENYNAINYLHNLQMDRLSQQYENDWSKITEIILYRGAIMSKSEFQSIHIGDYIELLGCISTSKDRNIVMKNFMRGNDYYEFVIKVKLRRLPEDLRCFDHGFTDLNQYDGIVPKEFQAEQQVLLNALNVYKITNIQQNEDGITRVEMEYGAIFDLLQKQTLTDEENRVILNYRYCVKQLNQIKNQGDVFMKLQQFKKCRQFNQKKISQLQKEIEQLNDQQFNESQQVKKEEKQSLRIQYLNKLSLANYNCGQTDEARVNAINSLESYQRIMRLRNQRQSKFCQKIYEIHQSTVKTLTQVQDTIILTKIIDLEIKILEQQSDWLKKAEKLIQRGQIYLKQGRIIQSEADLKQSESILLTKKRNFDQRRQAIEQRYYFKSFFNCLCFKNLNLESEKQQQLNQVQEDQKQYLSVKNKLHQLLLKVNQCLRNVAQTVGDKKTYEDCVKKGRQYFQELDKNTTSKQEAAEIKVVEAKVQNAFQKKTNIQNSYNLMEKAIQIIEQISPNHEKVAQYSILLGQFKKKSYLNFLTRGNKESIKRIKGLTDQQHEQKMSQKKQVSLKQSQSKINIMPLHNEQVKQKMNGSNHCMMRGTEQQIQQRLRKEQQKKRLQEIKKEQQRWMKFGLYNEPNYKPKYMSILQCFMKALSVLIFNKTEENPQVLEVRNHLGNVQYEFSNFDGGKKQANEVLKSKIGSKHSEGAKSALLLAKISLAQGQIKEAFQNIEKAHSILRLALIKQPNDPRYEELYKLSPIFLQIELYQCKVYNRQKNHDLALKTITNLRDLGKRKLRDADGVGYLADIYEEMGNTLVNKGDFIQFENCYQKAIQLREKQMGRYNIFNAIAYCSLAKYLVFTNDSDTAQKRVTDSLDIFGYFQKDHPNFWVHCSTMAYLSHKRQEKESELNYLRKSVKLVEKKLSKNNINLLKIKLRYAQVLSKNDNDTEALKIFEHLQRQIGSDVSLSQRGVELKETDNQKIAVKNIVEKSLSQTMLRITNKNKSQQQIPIAQNIPSVQNIRPIIIKDQLQAHEKTNAQLLSESRVIGQQKNQFNQHELSPRKNYNN